MVSSYWGQLLFGSVLECVSSWSVVSFRLVQLRCRIKGICFIRDKWKDKKRVRHAAKLHSHAKKNVSCEKSFFLFFFWPKRQTLVCVFFLRVKKLTNRDGF